MIVFKRVFYALFPANGKPKKKVRVLIVEDDDVIRQLWASVLRAIRVMVAEASSVSEALSQLNDADVLILDWRLGEDTSAAVLNTWNSIKDYGPCIVASGYMDPDDMAKLYSLGAYNTFMKPISAETLAGTVRHFVYNIELRRQVADLKEDVKTLRIIGYILFIAVVVAIAGGDITEIIKWMP